MLFRSKMYRFARETLWRREAHAEASVPAEDDEESLGWRYTRHAILYMREISRRAGATLVVVPITPHHPRQYRILEKIAVEYGLPFLDTTSLDARDPSLWLPRDGHFSAAGARRLATLEGTFLEEARR